MVRVRFAPSPTGFVHIGSLRTALYGYLYARANGGVNLLRIEDTDRTRLVEGAIENLLTEMSWAGIEFDEGPTLVDGKIVQRGEVGPYIQSERLPIYQEHLKELVDRGWAYPCFCSKERLQKLREENEGSQGFHGYDGHCRNIDSEVAKERMKHEEHVFRLRLPHDENISFMDLVRGNITMNTKDMDDQVLMKADGFPTYHFAVVVDDHLMGITHIIRGEEWLSSTPKHVLLYRAFGWQAPKFAHLPNILNEQKKKLSKREGDVSVSDFRKAGYLPEALVNILALVGWNPGDDQEILSMEELIQQFSFERVSKSGGVFNREKAEHINHLYIASSEAEHLYEAAHEYFDQSSELSKEKKLEIIDFVKERVSLLPQFNDFFIRFEKEYIEPEDDQAKEALLMDTTKELLPFFVHELEQREDFDAQIIKEVLKKSQKELGIKGKDLYMPMRAALMGEVHGLDLVGSFVILGKQKSIQRLKKAMDWIKHETL